MNNKEFLEIPLEERRRLLNSQESQLIYHEAIAKWGITAQLGMLTEECAELIRAVNRYWRADDIDGLLEELVDVEIMLGQIKFYFRAHDNEIAKWREKKLIRLRQALDA